MDELYTTSLEIIRWLQRNYPQLTGFMTAVSFFGSENFYLLIMPLLYWCVDKRLGRYVGYLFVISLLINAELKHLIRAPRPFWHDPAIAAHGSGEQDISHQYGFPSGHTQNTAVLLLFFASWVQKGWVWAAAIIAVGLMMLSRLYLGLHFLRDLAGGLLVAFIILLFYWIWKRFIVSRVRKQILGQRLLWATIPPTLLLIIYAVALYLLGEPETAVSWNSFIPAAELEGYKTFALAFGAFFGWAIGTLFEARDVRFQSGRVWWQRVLRFIIGIIGMLLVWRGLALLFPSEPTWLMLIFRAVRYFLTVFWVAYLAPMLFVRLNLADADPKPEISIKSWGV